VAYGLTWAPAARLDLKDLAAYIAEDDPIAAKFFLQDTPLKKSVPLDPFIWIKGNHSVPRE